MEKCYKCNKKSMILYECKCQKKFCIRHKHAEIHKCQFDYKQEQKDKLIKNKVEFRKINLI